MTEQAAGSRQAAWLNLLGELCKRGESANIPDDQGMTPLCYAACGEGDVIARCLVIAGADCDYVGPNGLTPLCFAASSNNLAAAEFLVENGARVDGAGEGTATPLHHSARVGALDVAKFLVESGARTDVKTSRGKTAADIALEYDRKEICDYLSNKAQRP